MAFNTFTSNSTGTGNFTFNEDVSNFLQVNDQFIAVIDYEKVVTWGKGEEANERIDTAYESSNCTYLGGGVFSRDIVGISSSNNQLVDFPGGVKTIDVEISAEKDIRNLTNVSITNNAIGVGVASASMILHMEAPDAQILAYDNSSPISDARPAWLFGPNGPTFNIASTNNTSSPLTNDVTRLTLNANGALTVNSITTSTSTVGNVVTDTDKISIGNSTVNIVANSTYIRIGNTTINAVINSTAFYVVNNNVFSPSTPDSAAIRIGKNYGGGIVLQDGSYKGSIFTSASGANLHFSAGDTTSLSMNKMQLVGGLFLGAPTGGDKGVGTLNAVGVYDDNVLLTCMALSEEFLETGKIDVEEWDKKAPHLHKTARMFADILDAGFDPRNATQYINKMLSDHALPGMPKEDEWQHNTISSGEMINRLWLAMEMLALTVVNLQKQLDAQGPKDG